MYVCFKTIKQHVKQIKILKATVMLSDFPINGSTFYIQADIVSWIHLWCRMDWPFPKQKQYCGRKSVVKHYPLAEPLVIMGEKNLAGGSDNETTWVVRMPHELLR